MTAPLPDVVERIAQLTAMREPFVHATVVRAQHPTSARPGDQAIVHRDGTIEGFVGGQCAVGAVRTAALDALAGGESLLLRVLPEGVESFPDAPGARVVVNPCLSGGSLEIFLQPMVPTPVVHVVGGSPIALAVAELADRVGFQVAAGEDSAVPPAGTVASVVSGHGHGEAEAIRAALDAGVPYVGLVASRKRGASVLDELRLGDDERARVRTPAGLDIGARTPGEIALSILADVVRAIRVDGIAPAAGAGGRSEVGTRPQADEHAHLRHLPLADQTPAQAPTRVVDPVCGMTVTVMSGTPHAVVGGQDYWFCCTSCRDRFVAEQTQGV
jgi:xanthine dehydrogenase accessory factor